MSRQRTFWFTVVILVLTSMACNAFAGNLEPTLAPPPTTPVQLETPIAGEMAATVTIAADTVDQVSQAAPGTVTILVDLNVRNGPGVQYQRAGFLLEGETAAIVGRHSESGWWKIECPANISGAECWISGGAEYAQATGAEAVPTVLAPPTPTPLPPEVEEDAGVLAYADGGRLATARLDLTQSPAVLSSDPQFLVDGGNIQALAISPDGQRVAYVAGDFQSNSLNVINVDGQDQRTLVSSTDLPVEVQTNASDFAALVGQIQWLDDSETLAFNSNIVNLVGPGFGSQVDLWTVSLDGDLIERFPAGQGGGVFAISADNQVLLSRSDNIVRINLDGSAGEVIIPFQAVNTASDYAYFPQLKWTTTGDGVSLISDPQPWQRGSGATFWHIPAAGPAVQMAWVDGLFLMNPVVWSADGGRVGFVQLLIDPLNPSMPTLVLAGRNGENASPYAGGDGLQFFEWHDNNLDFLYGGSGYFSVGRNGGPPQQTVLSNGQQAAGARWLTGDQFIVAVGFPENGNWELRSQTIAGSSVPLTTLSSDFDVRFDIWPAG